MDRKGESSLSIADALEDQERVDYFKGYLTNVQLAVETDGVDVRGYFAWSLLDNFEWGDGYTKRFGIHYVDYKSPVLARYPKRSAQFYSRLALDHSSRNAHTATITHLRLFPRFFPDDRRLRGVPPRQCGARGSTAQAHGKESTRDIQPCTREMRDQELQNARKYSSPSRLSRPRSVVFDSAGVAEVSL
jgi:hypothetical protein